MINNIQRRRFLITGAMTGAAGLLLSGSRTARGQNAPIIGAGTLFVALRMKLWLAEAPATPGLTIGYEPIGAGRGLNKLLRGDADFAATDLPTPDQKLAEANLLQIPLGKGGLAIVVNVAGITANQIQLNGELLAGIYSGAIKNWNDPKIAAVNPSLKLPDLDIRPLHVGDPSGSLYTMTYHFTQYLLATNADWRAKYGAAITKRWAVGSMVPDLNNMGDNIRTIPGSIGYMPIGRARADQHTTVKLKNADGVVIAPSGAAVKAAAIRAADAEKGGAFPTSLVNLPGAESWPIVIPSFALIPRTPKDPARGDAVLAFFRYVVGNGEGVSTQTDCAHLTKAQQGVALQLLNKTTG